MSTLELGTNMPAASHEAWLDAVDAALRGKSLDSLVSTDLGGFTRQPLYTQEAMADDNVSGLPGFVPYTRGARAVNDKFLPWQIAQRLTPGRKGSDQKAVMTDLNGGVSAIMLDFSQQLPTLAQLDKLLNEVMLDIAPLLPLTTSSYECILTLSNCLYFGNLRIVRECWQEKLSQFWVRYIMNHP